MKEVGSQIEIMAERLRFNIRALVNLNICFSKCSSTFGVTILNLSKSARVLLLLL